MRKRYPPASGRVRLRTLDKYSFRAGERRRRREPGEGERLLISSGIKRVFKLFTCVEHLSAFMNMDTRCAASLEIPRSGRLPDDKPAFLVSPGLLFPVIASFYESAGRCVHYRQA